MLLVDRAIEFAKEKHAGIFRKDGVTPYFEHCRAVAMLAEQYVSRHEHVIAAAYLHDTVEDIRDVTFDTINELFGEKVAFLVKELTFPSQLAKKLGNPIPKYLVSHTNRMHLRNITLVGKSMKMCDILHNLRDSDSLKIPQRQFLVEKTLPLLVYLNEKVHSELYQLIYRELHKVEKGAFVQGGGES